MQLGALGAAPAADQQRQAQEEQQQDDQGSQPRQRRRERERPPRGGQQQGLEAAASAAANRAQQRRQEQQAEGEEEEGAQSGSEPSTAGPQQPHSVEIATVEGRPPSGAAHSSAAAAASSDPPAEAPSCLVCCSVMAEVALGACNHKEVCGQCTLRLRLCYGRNDCPLCKAELKEVIIAPWRPQLPDWDAYQAHPEWVARSSKWARGEILADRWRRGGRLSSRLMHDLQRRTALACSLCDPGGEAPFQRREHLLRHMQEAHDQRLCSLCLQEGRLFPLELEPFPSLEALQAHTAASHPHCDFCRRTFYDSDALWKHMHQVHYACHVCPPPVAAHAYFNRATDLLAHMRAEHHLCEEPECADCFVAFESAEELRRHHLERHSARMPRWDASRARPLQLDISYTRRGGPTALAGRRERRRPPPRGPQDVRVLDSAGGSGVAQPEQQPARGDWPAEYEREADGGLLIIDDADFPAAGAAHGGRAGGAAGWGVVQPTQRPGGGGEDFPTLSTAAAVATASDGAPAGGGSSSGGSKKPPLVKKTAKCPCGRRVSHYAVAEGQEVPALECDAVCRLEGRRQQLADAFGVPDLEHHATFFETHRNATYSGLLLAAAQQHPKFIEGLERQLAAFIADKSSKRESLSAMPREQRQVAHALAEQYGLATLAFGQEPQRCIELIKTPSAGIPMRLLSRVAPTVSPEEVAALLREDEGHPMRITDMALSVDIRFYLRQWEGGYTLEWQGGDAAIVRFEKEADLKEALDVLGGGIRGLFRIDRSWRPKTAVAAVPASAGAGSSRGWGGGAAASGSASTSWADSSSWTAVAVAPPQEAPQRQQQEAAGAGEQQQQGGVGRWAVMKGRRAAPATRPPPAPAPLSAGSGSNAFALPSWGSRNVLAEATPELEDVVSDED